MKNLCKHGMKGRWTLKTINMKNKNKWFSNKKWRM